MEVAVAAKQGPTCARDTGQVGFDHGTHIGQQAAQADARTAGEADVVRTVDRVANADGPDQSAEGRIAGRNL